MTSSKIKNNIPKTILAPWYREWIKQWRYLRFVEMVFIFSGESYYFLKLYEKEAKPGKQNFKRGLVVALDVKNS